MILLSTDPSLMWTGWDQVSFPSKPVVLLLHSWAFPGILVGLMFAHLAKWRTLVLGHVCLPTPRPQRRPHCATDTEPGTCVWQFPKWPCSERGHNGCAGFQQSGPTLAGKPWGGMEGVRWGGTYWQGPAMFSEAQSSGSITQCDEEKRSAANESQQCLSHWTTSWKALCNWDAINISKLSLNKLSVYFSHILAKLFAIGGTALHICILDFF